VEEVEESWTWWRRRSVVSMVVPGCGGEGRVDGAVLGCINVEEEWGIGVDEERGAGMETHAEDAEEGAWWRWTRRKSGHRWVYGGEMKGLGFRGSGTLKKKNSSDGHDDIINTRHYIWIRFLKNRV
jgi:hypothetical protein